MIGAQDAGQSVEIGVMGLDFGIAHQPAPRFGRLARTFRPAAPSIIPRR
jgi:hypothetical protein